MTHTLRVQLLQAVHARGQVRRGVQVVEPNASTEDGTTPVLWGSRDVLDIATALVSREGYRASDCTLAYLSFDPVEGDTARDLKDGLLAAINSGDKDKAERFQSSVLLDYLILGVTVSLRHPLASVRLLQNGQVQVVRATDTAALIGAIERAASDTH